MGYVGKAVHALVHMNVNTVVVSLSVWEADVVYSWWSDETNNNALLCVY